MNLRRLPLVLVLCAMAAPAQRQEFRVQSNLVQAPVVVTDEKGRPVEGLEAEDFVLLDNGKVRPVEMDSFGAGLAPVSLIVAVQSSGISTAALNKVRKISAIIQPLLAGERGCAAVVAFSERIEWLQECTSDAGLIEIAFAKLRPLGFKRARMLDAAAEAVERLKARPSTRRILLLISESRDRGSETDLEQVAVAAEASGVMVYAATFSAFGTAFTDKDAPQAKTVEGMRRSTPGKEEPGAPLRRDRDPNPTPPEQRVDVLGGLEELGRLGSANTVEILTRRTGGLAQSFTRLKGLEEAMLRLSDEVHGQYVLSFAPEEGAVGYRRLEVRLKRAGDYQVRARPGYWVGTN
jgi:VWFA-related protein